MTYVVKSTLGTGRNKRRVTSRKFRKKTVARHWANLINQNSPGANARISSV